MKKITLMVASSLFVLFACNNKKDQPNGNSQNTIEQLNIIHPDPQDKVTETVSHLNFRPDSIKMSFVDNKSDTSWPGDGCDCPSTLRSFRGDFTIYKNGRSYGAEILGETFLKQYWDASSPEEMTKKNLDTSFHPQSYPPRLSYEAAKLKYQQIFKNKKNLLISLVEIDRSNIYLQADSVVFKEANSSNVLWLARRYVDMVWASRD